MFRGEVVDDNIGVIDIDSAKTYSFLQLQSYHVSTID